MFRVILVQEWLIRTLYTIHNSLKIMESNNNAPSVDCVIKLGGAAITIKDDFETLNQEILENVAVQVHQMHSKGLRLIIVHGAGSFGHFQAATYGIAHGGNPTAAPATTLQGFAQTRLSVTKLNHLVVSSLVNHGIPAIGVSPLGSWTTTNRKIATDGCHHIATLLAHGYVPVIHGDAIDTALQCTILGGDPIMTRLCQYFKPRIAAVYMTNVAGIYDRPPLLVENEKSGRGAASASLKANLLREIVVDKNTGSWIAYGMGGLIINSIETSELEHDSTGGIKQKVSEAVEAVMGTTRVRVVKAGTEAALDACTLDTLPDDWQGTELTLDM